MSRTSRVSPVLLFSLAAACIEQASDDDTGPHRGDEHEPNDSPEHAGELRLDEPVRGRIERGDRDWWRLELEPGAVASFQVFGARLDQAGWGANPPTLTVVGPDGAPHLLQDPLGEPSFGWGALDPDIPAYRAETGGMHYLVVAADDERLAGGAYLLVAQPIGDALALEAEPPGARGANDSCATAEPLAPGVLAGFHADGEEDWFQLDVPERSLVTFAVVAHRNGLWRGDDDTFDSELALFDARGVERARNDDGAFDDSLLSYVCASGGEWFLRVREACGSGDAPYFLVHEVRSLADALGEEEPNDSPSSAPSVLFDRPIEGMLTPGDVDVFAVSFFAGDRLELWLHDRGRNERATGTLRAVLADGRGEPVPMDAGRELGVRTALIASDGIVFLRLEPEEPGATDYAFELRLETAAFESEPNDVPAQATAFTTRRSAGRIERPDDVDHFAFEARAGVPVLLECFADDEFGSLGFDELDGSGSDLDPLLAVLDPRGAVVASASALPRTALGIVRGRATVALVCLPRADGTHVLAVRDARGGSGPSHTYAVERH